MAEHDIRGVQSALNAVVRTIESAVTQLLDVVAPLKELPTLVRDQTVHLRDGFRHQMQLLAAMKLAEQAAVAASQKRRAEGEREALAETEQRLRVKRESVEADYGHILDELETENRRRVRELDAHAFAVLEEDYEQHVKLPLQTMNFPSLTLVERFGLDACAVREHALGSEASGLVDQFRQIERASEVGLRLLESLSTPGAPAEPPLCAMRVYIVDIEGQASKLIVFPDELIADESGRLAYRPRPELQAVGERLRPVLT